MTSVKPSCSGPRAPIADCALCQFCLLRGACMYVFVKAELYPVLFVHCLLVDYVPCTLEHLCWSQSSSHLHFCFGRTTWVCLCVCVCVCVLLFVCDCDPVCSTIALSVACLSERHHFCSSDEETGDLYPQCLPVHLYLHWLSIGFCSLH